MRDTGPHNMPSLSEQSDSEGQIDDRREQGSNWRAMTLVIGEDFERRELSTDRRIALSTVEKKWKRYKTGNFVDLLIT